MVIVSELMLLSLCVLFELSCCVLGCVAGRCWLQVCCEADRYISMHCSEFASSLSLALDGLCCRGVGWGWSCCGVVRHFSVSFTLGRQYCLLCLCYRGKMASFTLTLCGRLSFALACCWVFGLVLRGLLGLFALYCRGIDWGCLCCRIVGRNYIISFILACQLQREKTCVSNRVHVRHAKFHPSCAHDIGVGQIVGNHCDSNGVLRPRGTSLQKAETTG